MAVNNNRRITKLTDDGTVSNEQSEDLFTKAVNARQAEGLAAQRASRASQIQTMTPEQLSQAQAEGRTPVNYERQDLAFIPAVAGTVAGLAKAVPWAIGALGLGSSAYAANRAGFFDNIPTTQDIRTGINSRLFPAAISAVGTVSDWYQRAKAAIGDMTSPRETVGDMTSPRETAADTSGTTETVGDMTSPRETAANTTGTTENVGDMTNPRGNPPEPSEPSEPPKDPKKGRIGKFLKGALYTGLGGGAIGSAIGGFNAAAERAEDSETREETISGVSEDAPTPSIFSQSPEEVQAQTLKDIQDNLALQQVGAQESYSNLYARALQNAYRRSAASISPFTGVTGGQPAQTQQALSAAEISRLGNIGADYSQTMRDIEAMEIAANQTARQAAIDQEALQQRIIDRNYEMAVRLNEVLNDPNASEADAIRIFNALGIYDQDEIDDLLGIRDENTDNWWRSLWDTIYRAQTNFIESYPRLGGALFGE